jgi:hypothetical protein
MPQAGLRQPVLPVLLCNFKLLQACRTVSMDIWLTDMRMCCFWTMLATSRTDRIVGSKATVAFDAMIAA